MKTLHVIPFIVFTIVNIGIAKTVPSAIWLQKDVKEASSGDSASAQNRILIVGRSSIFKDDVISDLFDSFKTMTSTYVKSN